MWKLISESFDRGSREDVKKKLMGSGLIQEIVPELAACSQGPFLGSKGDHGFSAVLVAVARNG